MKLHLTYFKPSGKYYSEAEPDLDADDLPAAWKAVFKMAVSQTLPGLVKGHGEFIVLVRAPGHPHDHPKLLNLGILDGFVDGW